VAVMGDSSVRGRGALPGLDRFGLLTGSYWQGPDRTELPAIPRLVLSVTDASQDQLVRMARFASPKLRMTPPLTTDFPQTSHKLRGTTRFGGLGEPPNRP